MKKLSLTVLSAAAFCMASSSVFAAYSFTSVGQTITENFTNYGGTAMPTNWAFQNANNNANFATAYRGANNGLTSGSGGVYSMGVAAGNTNRMLGYIGNSNLPNNAALVASYTNNTGAALTQLTISYSAGQWYAQQSRMNFFTVQYSVNGGAWTSVSGLTYNAAFNAFNNSNNMGFVNGSVGTGGSLASNNSTGGRTGLNGFSNTGAFNGNFANLSSTVTLGTAWNPGDTLEIRWVYNNVGSAGADSRQLLAIDNVAVSAVPEPNTVMLFGASAASILFFLRRRKVA